jgi:tetratricopeptide (TPR) repeat protein
VVAAFAIHAAVGRGSAGLMNTIYSWGAAVPAPPSYPRQDALIARGQYAEAAEYFRDHIRVTPEDLDARLRLADLAEHQLKDDAEAERLYAEVRKLAKTRDHEFAAANGLIDLYRRVGRRDRLRVELARFAERYQGSAAGKAAAAELRELKAGDATT